MVRITRSPTPRRAPQFDHGPWDVLILAANTELEVLTIVQQMLFSIDPAELERLPRECRQVAVTDIASLAAWALRLTRVERRALFPFPRHGLLHSISEVLCSAQGQVVELQGLR